jgi:hypothetical protein
MSAMSDQTRRPRAVAVVASLAATFALMAGGCGDDAEGGKDANADAAPAPAASPDEAEIRSTFKRFEVAFQNGDGYRACRMLTEAARKEAGKLIGDYTCERSVAQLGDTAGDLEQKPSKILSVRFSGDKATASVSDAGRAPVALPFEKEDGKWKIADLGFEGN